MVLPKATEGRRNRIEARATAFSHRGALCEWGCLSSWLDPAADDVNVRRTRELAEVMRPFTTDSDYVNCRDVPRLLQRDVAEITTP